jgi:hypothetical protein
LRGPPERIRSRAKVAIVPRIAQEARGPDEAVDAGRVWLDPEDAAGDGRSTLGQGLDGYGQQSVEAGMVFGAKPGGVMVALGGRQPGDERMTKVMNALGKGGR